VIVSTLYEVLVAYMVSKGFHRTYAEAEAAPLNNLWGHAELGEARKFMDCVAWQIAREKAAAQPSTRG
jgi:hypothetical protein